MFVCLFIYFLHWSNGMIGTFLSPWTDILPYSSSSLGQFEHMSVMMNVLEKRSQSAQDKEGLFIFSPATIVRARDGLTFGCGGREEEGGEGWGWWVSEWVCVSALCLTRQWWRRRCDKQLREAIGWVVRCGQGKPTVVYHLWNKISASCATVGVCGPGLPHLTAIIATGCLSLCFPCTGVFTHVCKHLRRAPVTWKSASHIKRDAAASFHGPLSRRLSLLSFLLDSTTVLPFDIVNVLWLWSELIISTVLVGLLLYVYV